MFTIHPSRFHQKYGLHVLLIPGPAIFDKECQLTKQWNYIYILTFTNTNSHTEKHETNSKQYILLLLSNKKRLTRISVWFCKKADSGEDKDGCKGIDHPLVDGTDRSVEASYGFHIHSDVELGRKPYVFSDVLQVAFPIWLEFSAGCTHASSALEIDHRLKISPWVTKI